MKSFDFVDVVYEIPFPVLPNDLYNFSFPVNTDSGVFNFTFQWFNDIWNCYVTLPDNTIRTVGVIPYVINWSDYLDYSLYFSYGASNSISFGDLENAKIEIIKWLQ